MPIFEYGCWSCGKKFEILIIGDRKPECPRCHELENLEQLVSRFAMSFRESTGMMRGPAANMYENFTVPHVKDKLGRPIVVNSLKELRAAEKEHHFAYGPATDNNILTAEAPTNETWAGDIRHDYNWKWAKDPEKRNDRAGVSTGSGKLDKRRKAVA